MIGCFELFVLGACSNLSQQHAVGAGIGHALLYIEGARPSQGMCCGQSSENMPDAHVHMQTLTDV